jgi:suppressor for copper-sensitivity B
MKLRDVLPCAAALLLAGQAATAGCSAPCDGAAATASATGWSGDAQAPTRLILARASHDGGDAIWAGIEMRIASGWFTYWRTPGEAGAGPRVEWGGSRNLGLAGLRWPAPLVERIDEREVNIYRGHVVLPIRLAPAMGDADIDVELRFSYAVCGEVCRPAFSLHRLRVLAKPVPETQATAAQAALIERFLDLVPGENGRFALGAVGGVRIDPAAGTIRFEIDRRMLGFGSVPVPMVIVEAPRPLVAGATHLESEEGGRMMFSAPVSGPSAPHVSGSVTITVIGDGSSFEQTISLDGH